MKHYLLLIFFIAFSGSILFSKDKTNNYQNLNAKKAKALIDDYDKKSKKLIIIDVRTKEEFDKGHLKKAQCIDFFDNNFEENIISLDKKVPYLIHCQSGGRSMKAYKLMQSLGFKNVYHLDGGMLAWKKLGERIQK